MFPWRFFFNSSFINYKNLNRTVVCLDLSFVIFMRYSLTITPNNFKESFSTLAFILLILQNFAK